MRAEALQHIGNVHRESESIPVLLRALGQEKGRMKHDVASVLAAHDRTGPRPQSRTAGRRGGAKEGATFSLADLRRSARKAETERTQRREENNTATSFYGLEGPLRSRLLHRRCLRIHVDELRTGEAGRSRFRTRETGGRRRDRTDATRRRERTTGVDDQGPGSDGVLFNMIFFQTDVFAWEENLVTLDEESRERTPSNTRMRQRAAGGTSVYDALALAFQDESIDTIFLLTDGAPSSGSIIDPTRHPSRRSHA